MAVSCVAPAVAAALHTLHPNKALLLAVPPIALLQHLPGGLLVTVSTLSTQTNRCWKTIHGKMTEACQSDKLITCHARIHTRNNATSTITGNQLPHHCSSPNICINFCLSTIWPYLIVKYRISVLLYRLNRSSSSPLASPTSSKVITVSRGQ